MKENKIQVNLQVSPGSDLRAAEALVAGTPGVKKVTQVFPHHEDEELERMYVVELEQVSTLAKLRAFAVVESVELTPGRGIRPT